MKPLRIKVLLFSLGLLLVSSFMSCTPSQASELPTFNIELSDHPIVLDAGMVAMKRFETKSQFIMNKVTKADIEAWKEKYEVVYELHSSGKKAYIFDPSCDLNIMKMVATAAQKGVQGMTEKVLNSCWLGGDEELKTDEAYKLGVSEEIADLIEMPDFEVEIKKDHAMVYLPKGEPVKLNLATRGDVKYAESRNKDNKPFQTAVYLLDRIAQDHKVIAEIKKDNRMYMGLLLATNEVKDKKYVEVKKL